MRRATIALLMLVAAASARAQMPGMPHVGGGDMGMSWGRAFFVLFDQLEYAPGSEQRTVNLDARSWYGGAYRRIWLRAQGEAATTTREGEAEADLLFGKLVDPFWDAVIGLHVDQRWGDRTDRRVQLAVGFVGLAPYRFELEPTLYVSQHGDLSARLEAGFPLLLTQRLIAEPELELNAALQAVPDFGIRRGLNDYEYGLRIRYEFRRELGPYLGWSYSRRTAVSPTGATVAVPVESQLVVGVRLWR